MAAPGSATGKQHVQMYRKLLLRRRLMRWAQPGAVYVPFIGDGDIAADLYRDRQVFGADLDPDRVVQARAALGHDARVEVADCNDWPFPNLRRRIAIADFDAYVDPYVSFKSMWREHRHYSDRLVVTFTDGRRQGLMRTGSWTKPDGQKILLGPRVEKATVFNAYLSRHVWPWFEAHIEPWRILDLWRYQRGWMVYWGAAIQERK